VHFHLLSDRSDRIEQFLPENPGKYQLLFREILDCWNLRKPGYKHFLVEFKKRMGVSPKNYIACNGL